MKVAAAVFEVVHGGMTFVVRWIYTSEKKPIEVRIEPPEGEPAKLENTHGRWKPCQTHAFEAVRLLLEKPVSEWSNQRLEAKPVPKPLGVFVGDDFDEVEGFQDFDQLKSMEWAEGTNLDEEGMPR